MSLQYEILFPSTFLIFFILSFIWYGTYIKNKVTKYSLAQYFGFLSTFALIITLFFELSSFKRFEFYSTFFLENKHEAFSNNFINTPLSSLIILLTLFISILVILACSSSESSLDTNQPFLEINILRLVIVFSLVLIAMSNNIVVTFFLLEIYSFSSYILVGKTSKISLFSSEAALKYFFIGSVFSILMVYSIASLYAITGIVTISELKIFFIDSKLIFTDSIELYFICFLLLSTLLFKIAVAPFHFWSPDVYEGAPTTTMFFLSVVPKITLFYIIIKLNFFFQTIWFFFIIFALLSIVVGSTMGVFQTKVKRLLAYSMISNSGLLFGLLAFSEDTLVLCYFLFYLLVYSLTLIGIFSVVLTNKSNFDVFTYKNIYSMTNLRESNITKYIIFVVFLFASAGIPPFVGFFIKFFVLFSYIENSFFAQVFIWFAIIFLTFSVFYYIRLLKIMSFSKKKFWIFFLDAPYTLVFVIILSFLFSIVTLLCFSTIINFLLIIT